MPFQSWCAFVLHQSSQQHGVSVHPSCSRCRLHCSARVPSCTQSWPRPPLGATGTHSSPSRRPPTGGCPRPSGHSSSKVHMRAPFSRHDASIHWYVCPPPSLKYSKSKSSAPTQNSPRLSSGRSSRHSPAGAPSVSQSMPRPTFVGRRLQSSPAQPPAQLQAVPSLVPFGPQE